MSSWLWMLLTAPTASTVLIRALPRHVNTMAGETLARRGNGMLNRTTRNTMILMALAAMCLLLVALAAGCGGGEQEPVETSTPTATAAESPTTQEPQDVVDVIVADGRFTTLASALQSAGLVRTGFGLKGEGPMTVFAPTDEAFAQLPKEQLDELLADPMGALQQVLTYHVVEDKLMAGDISDGMKAVTAQGEELTFAVKGASIEVDGARIIEADIPAPNGVVHVIDAVMIPQSLSAQQE